MNVCQQIRRLQTGKLNLPKEVKQLILTLSDFLIFYRTAAAEVLCAALAMRCCAAACQAGEMDSWLWVAM
ncbi:MAG: hypothetical protein JWR15_2707 [Prosthecobacter sp.]|nr:hypothetical protein [Prosthecobacter sp.]